jgi:hypothetical protein
VAGDIERWRDFCTQHTGNAKLHHWLAGYQGYNRPKEGIWCGQKQVDGVWKDVPTGWHTKTTLEYRDKLIHDWNNK